MSQAENQTADPIPLEMAARAIARVATAKYPDTKAGRAAADKYVEENWRYIWETLS